MILLESTLGGGRFFASSSTIAGNSASICNNPCAPGGDYSTAVGNGSWDNTHTSDSSNRGKKLGREPNTLVQCTQRTNGSLRSWAPTPLGFPHIMLSVKLVKDNMQLAFIEKFFTNREIGTNIQTKYLCFKGVVRERKLLM
jgi:hypothetical protein